MPNDVFPEPHRLSAEELKDIFHSVLDERSRVDSEVHTAHHDYIQTLINRTKARKDFYEKILGILIEKGLPGLLWAMVIGITGYITAHIKWSGS